MRGSSFFVLVVAGCAGDKTTSPTTPTRETDADTDSDADADADSDSDTATATTVQTPTGDTGLATVTITGEWIGDCVPVATYYLFNQFTFDLNLTEVAGAVTGNGRLTWGGPYGTYQGLVEENGAWDGVTLDLGVAASYTYSIIPLGSMYGPVSGPTWTASFASNYGFYDCSLARQ